MIWIKVGNASYLAIGCNTSSKDNKHSLWIERMNGKTLKVAEGSQEEVTEIKEALDFSVENGFPVFEIK